MRTRTTATRRSSCNAAAYSSFYGLGTELRTLVGAAAAANAASSASASASSTEGNRCPVAVERDHDCRVAEARERGDRSAARTLIGSGPEPADVHQRTTACVRSKAA